MTTDAVFHRLIFRLSQQLTIAHFNDLFSDRLTAAKYEAPKFSASIGPTIEDTTENDSAQFE
jgi:hypothetical protein